MSAGNFDETVSLNEIEFGSLNEMWIGGVGVEVLPQAQRLLANRSPGSLHIPRKRCPADLQAENLNHWLETGTQAARASCTRFNEQRQVARKSLRTATGPSTTGRFSFEDAGNWDSGLSRKSNTCLMMA